MKPKYGFGFYTWGVWFGWGQLDFRRWRITLCTGMFPGGYYKRWWHIGVGA